MLTYRLLPFIFVFTLLISGCKKDKMESESLYTNGVFITNEGSFGSANGSLSFYYSNGDSVANDIFSRTNDFQLGDVVQSMTLHNNKGYICVNVSGKVEVVNPETMESLGTINNVPNPRYFLGINANKAYISSWDYSGGSEVSIVDLNRMEKTGSISLQVNWPEQMMLLGGKAYIANANSDTLLIVNTTEDIIESVITTPQGPSQMVKDQEGKLWVLCSGKTVYNPIDWSVDEAASIPASLIQIDPVTNTISEINTFPSIYSSPSNLAVNPVGDALYYLQGGSVMKKPIGAIGLPNVPFIEGSNFTYAYGLAINSDNGDIYVSDALDFTLSGNVYKYQADGLLLNSIFGLGIGPSEFVFVD